MVVDEAGEFSSSTKLAGIKKPKRGRDYWRDALTPGLYFVVSATGRRAWATPLEDKEGWMTLGLYGDGRMSLEDARKAITMPHARESGLKRLAPMLEQLRKIKALKEARPGIFRFRSKPFLHLHHLVAHVRLSAPEFDSLDHSPGWSEINVATRSGQQTLVCAIKEHVLK